MLSPDPVLPHAYHYQGTLGLDSILLIGVAECAMSTNIPRSSHLPQIGCSVRLAVVCVNDSGARPRPHPRLGPYPDFPALYGLPLDYEVLHACIRLSWYIP